MRAAAVVLVFALLAVSLPAAAQSDRAREQARAAAAAGAAHLEQGDYDKALDKFQEAYRLVKSPRLFFNFGLAYAALARPAEAFEAFEAFLREATDAPAERRAEATERLTELRARVAFVEVASPVASTKVSIDGRPRGTTPLSRLLVLDPGTHQVIAEASIFERPWVHTFTAAAGKTTRLTVVVPKAAPPAPAPQIPIAAVTEDAPAPVYKRAWFWVAVGVAVAAGVAGGWYATRSGASSCPSGIPDCIRVK